MFTQDCLCVICHSKQTRKSILTVIYKGGNKSTLVTDSSVPLIRHDPREQDHSKGTHPKWNSQIYGRVPSG